MPKKVSKGKSKECVSVAISKPTVSHYQSKKRKEVDCLEAKCDCSDSKCNCSPSKRIKTDSEDLSFANLEQGIPISWRSTLEDQFTKLYFKSLKNKLIADEKQRVEIFPPKPLIFNAFELCPWNEIKVVILGQDPYHDNGQAEGLCFSVPKGVKIPSSLTNIFKELCNDVQAYNIPSHGCLTKWAKQGVLLLNTVLTVKAHAANSHKAYGWQKFTDVVVSKINKEKEGVIFLLWGGQAHIKGKGIDPKKHHVLKCPHPSGLSAHKKTEQYPFGFFKNRHFAQANEILIQQGQEPIDWQT